MSFTSWLLGERIVTFERRHDLMAFQITVTRRDGLSICKHITDEELMVSRVPPIEIAQRLFDHPLDRVAVGIVARRTRHVNTMRTYRGVSVPDAPPSERFGRIQPVIDRPKPLAPPNPDPDFPMYRPR